jgi:small nuclear ribonucleoprotein (snRNP)-like protein
MIPTQKGQLVRFHTPFPDEDPGQQYVILDLFNDEHTPRAHIKALGTKLSLVPINTVLIEDLELVEFGSGDLLGQELSVQTEDGKIFHGKIIKVEIPDMGLNFEIQQNFVLTNIQVIIQGEYNEQHSGSLILDIASLQLKTTA